MRVLALLIVTFAISKVLALSQIKVICDRDGSRIYVDGKMKAECEKDEPVRILLLKGKHTLKVLKQDEAGNYEYIKTFTIGDGVQKVFDVTTHIKHDEYFYYKKASHSNDINDLQYYLNHFTDHKKEILDRLEYLKAINDYNYFIKNKKYLKNNPFYHDIVEFFSKNPIKTFLNIQNFALNKNFLSYMDYDNNIYIYKKNGVSFFKKMTFANKSNRSKCFDMNNFNDLVFNNANKLSIIRNLIDKETLSDEYFCYDAHFFHNERNKIAIIGKNGIEIDIWDVLKKKKIYSKNELYDLSAFALSTDDRSIYFSRYKDYNDNFKFPLYQVALPGQKIRFLSRFQNEIKVILPMNDGQHVLLGLENGNNLATIYLYNVQTRMIEREFNIHTPIKSLDIKDNLLISGDSNGKLTIWDFNSGAKLLELDDTSSIKKVAWGQHLVFSLNDQGKLNIWKPDLKRVFLKKCRGGNVSYCVLLVKENINNDVAIQALLHTYETLIGKKFTHPKLYLVKKYQVYQYGNRKSNINAQLISVLEANNRIYVLIKFNFQRSGFTFNSPIYFVSNDRKTNYEKHYPESYKIGNKNSLQDSKDIVLEYKGTVENNGIYSIVEGSGKNGNLLFKNFILKEVL